jgi:hypothetical protein
VTRSLCAVAEGQVDVAGRVSCNATDGVKCQVWADAPAPASATSRRNAQTRGAEKAPDARLMHIPARDATGPDTPDTLDWNYWGASSA